MTQAPPSLPGATPEQTIAQSPTAPPLPSLPPSQSNAPIPDPTPAPVTPALVAAPSAAAPVKPGLTTTEFWLSGAISAATVVCSLVLLIRGWITSSQFTTLLATGGAGPVALYTVMRSLLKAFAPQVDLPPAPGDQVT